MEIGDQAPDFCLPDQDGQKICLDDFSGKWRVLYFYPKDNTSRCTKEALDFSESKEEFEKMNAIVLGVSPDSVESHRRFAEKNNLKITLFSNSEREVLKKYGVWRLKKAYGKEFWEVVRSTFLINPDGKISQIWGKVRVKGHVEEVRNTLKKMNE